MRLVIGLLCISLITGCSDVNPPNAAPYKNQLRAWSAETGAYTQPLEGVRVCEGDTDDNCVFSDANGDFTLWLPADQEVFYTIQKEGYETSLWSVVIPESGRTDPWTGMTTDELMAEMYEGAMSPYPRLGTGDINIKITPVFAGATFELVGATGTPYYQVG